MKIKRTTTASRPNERGHEWHDGDTGDDERGELKNDVDVEYSLTGAWTRTNTRKTSFNTATVVELLTDHTRRQHRLMVVVVTVV